MSKRNDLIGYKIRIYKAKIRYNRYSIFKLKEKRK